MRDDFANGLIDGYTPAIAQTTPSHSEPYTDKRIFAFSNQGKRTVCKLEDLKNTVVVVTLGFTYGDKFAKAKQEKWFKIEEVSSDVLNVKKLKENHLDFFLVDELPGKWYMNKYNVKFNYSANSPPIEILPIFLALNRKFKEECDRISRVIREMREDGTLKSIIDKVLQDSMKPN